MRRFLPAFFLALLLLAAGNLAAQMRTFTDRNGRTVQAERVAVENGAATLRLADGKIITVPVTQFSAADQAVLAATATPATVASAPVGEPVTWDHEAKVRNVPGLKDARFRVWLPDVARPVRGMILLMPGTNGDARGDAGAGDWQTLARELNFGLIAGQMVSGDGGSGYCYAANGSGEVLLDALAEGAAAKNRPELAKVPLLLWGHSAGGQFNYNFACWKPERTLGFVVNKGGFYYDTKARPATRATPAILFAGERDTAERVRNITTLFETGRAGGALWALCVEKGVDHGVGRSRTIAQQFFRSVVRVRLPAGASEPMKKLGLDDGLLAAPGEEPVPAAQFKGERRKASWLPDAATAAAWKSAL